MPSPRPWSTDIQDLVKDTGFAPDYKFSEGIAETVEWCKKEI